VTLKRTLWLVLLPGLLSACETHQEKEAREEAAKVEAVKAYIDANRQAPENKLAAIAAIQKKAKKVLPLKEDGIRLSEGMAQPDFRESGGNAGKIHIDRLADLSVTPEVPIDVAGGEFHWWLAPASLLVNGTNVQGKPQGYLPAVEESFAHLAAIRFVLVARVHEQRLPKFAELTEEGSSFTPGMVKGDVLLYDIQDGKLLGGVVYQAHSSDSMTRLFREDSRKVLNMDLQGNASKSVTKGMKTALPQATWQ